MLGTDSNHYRAASWPRIRWKPNEWHHIAGTWRAKCVEVYMDGKREGIITHPLIPERLADTFVVGGRPWHVSRKRQTLVDEIKLYSVPLDIESIARAARGEPVLFKPEMLIETTVDPDTAILRVTCDAAGLVGELEAGRKAHVELVPKVM